MRPSGFGEGTLELGSIGRQATHAVATLDQSMRIPRASGAPAGRHYRRPGMSTRRLIFAALVCGLAILVAFTVQVLMVGR